MLGNSLKFSFLFSYISLCFSTENLPEIHKINGDVIAPLSVQVDKLNEYIVYYKHEDSAYPFRVKVSSENADRNNPIIVVVRQETEVTSWVIPVSEKTSKNNENFYNTSARTLCPQHMNEINEIDTKSMKILVKREIPGFIMKVFTQEFTIAISSSCETGTDVRVEVEEEKNFYVQEGEETTLSISTSQSRYVFYKFHNHDSDTLTIEVTSDDDVCLTISIQESQCPVFDLTKDIKYRGKYQTISRNGGLIIKKKDYTHGFFLVFVVLPDNYDCVSEYSSFLSTSNSDFFYMEQSSDVTSNVSFTIRNSFSKKEYWKVTLVTFVTIVIFYMIAIGMIVGFRRFGSMKNLRNSTTDLALDEENIDDSLPRSPIEIVYVLEKSKLNVRTLAKYPMKDKRRSFNYLWHIISIAIFYSIPVVQLVITYQRIVNSTGNEDLCYYNFLCAHPLFAFSDFNHIFSNIGYFFMGFLFLGATFYRQKIVPFRYEIGLPVHYGLFYAMGIALILEGLLSACYHICPSQSNYQFDTSFMYIMIVLCMIKLYQNRHPDLNATSYATFSVLGFGIFIATVGILYGNLSIWLIFMVGYFIFCFYLSFKIYYMSFVFYGLKKFRDDISKNGFVLETFQPVKKARFIVLFLANLINIGILIIGLVLYSKGSTDFDTFLLGLLMANGVLHMIFYTVMKLVNGEKICIEAIVYGTLGLITWIVAMIFFIDAATLWTVTPAESRQWNQECILMGYYDKHDVWHLLSASALYFTFMFLTCLDDDIIDKRQEDIPVF